MLFNFVAAVLFAADFNRPQLFFCPPNCKTLFQRLVKHKKREKEIFLFYLNIEEIERASLHSFQDVGGGVELEGVRERFLFVEFTTSARQKYPNTWKVGNDAMIIETLGVLLSQCADGKAALLSFLWGKEII